MKNQKTMGNKGFSLVELIVVIAIMAVLVGVLAPQFIKYVKSSRLSTDIQNIEQMKTAVEVDYADGAATGTCTISRNGNDIKCSFKPSSTSQTVALKSTEWSSDFEYEFDGSTWKKNKTSNTIDNKSLDSVFE